MRVLPGIHDVRRTLSAAIADRKFKRPFHVAPQAPPPPAGAACSPAARQGHTVWTGPAAGGRLAKGILQHLALVPFDDRPSRAIFWTSQQCRVMLFQRITPRLILG